MLTVSEKRFIKYWEEQRRGGRLQYYLLYILAGTFIASIVVSFVGMMFWHQFLYYILEVFLGCFVLVIAITVWSWAGNEKKFKAIIQREVKEGKERDSLHASQ